MGSLPTQTTNISHVVIIDQNRLFREKIEFILKQPASNNPLSKTVTSSYQSLDEIPSGNSIDLLLVSAYASGCSTLYQSQLKGLLKRFPALKIIEFTEDPLNSTSNNLLKEPIYHTIHRSAIEPITLNKQIDVIAFSNWISKLLNKDSQHLSQCEPLTPREHEILKRLATGDSNKIMARNLSISESTVKVHVQNILKKLKVTNRLEAAVYSIKHELINE